jgi:hypothetical protein
MQTEGQPVIKPPCVLPFLLDLSIMVNDEIKEIKLYRLIWHGFCSQSDFMGWGKHLDVLVGLVLCQDPRDVATSFTG